MNWTVTLTPEILNDPNRIKKGFYTIGRADPDQKIDLTID